MCDRADLFAIRARGAAATPASARSRLRGSNASGSSGNTKANTALNSGHKESAFSFQSQTASVSKAMRMAGVTSADLLTAREDVDSDEDDDDDHHDGNVHDDHQQLAAKPAANVPPALARRRSSAAAQNALIRSFNSKMNANGSSSNSTNGPTGSGSIAGTGLGTVVFGTHGGKKPGGLLRVTSTIESWHGGASASSTGGAASSLPSPASASSLVSPRSSPPPRVAPERAIALLGTWSKEGIRKSTDSPPLQK